MKKQIVIISTGIILLLLGIIFDNQIASFFIKNQNQTLNYILQVITYFGSGYIIIPFLTLLFIIKDRSKIFRMWLIFAITLLITYTLKSLIARERPIGDDFKSFPSGHTVSAFTALPFAFRYGFKFGYAWLVFAFLILFTRIYLNQHYLTDVASSLLIGYTVSELISLLSDKQALHNKT